VSDANAEKGPARDGELAGQLVPWRETCREVIDLVAFKTGDELDEQYEILQELIEDQWADLIARINAYQGSIKSVTVFSRGKTHTYHEKAIGQYGGYGFGYGWGIEIPDFVEVEVLYEVCDYIPVSEYRNRKARSVKDLESQGGFKSTIERLRQRYNDGCEELERIESSLAHEQSKLDDIDAIGVRERPGMFVSKWRFQGVEYDTRDEADDAKERLYQPQKAKVDRLKALRDRKQNEVEALRPKVESLDNYSGQAE